MINTSDVADLLGHIAFIHPRTAPRIDDEQAMELMAREWARLFNAHQLVMTDLVAAVRKRSESGSSEAPEPGEIIAVAREIRRDRAQREDDELRKAREDAWDAKLAERESWPVLPPPNRAIRGRYQATEPAGWEYGVPTHDSRESEREGHKVELETRVAQLRAKRPELSNADAEREIREGDRARAETFLANIGRHGLASVVGGIGRGVPGGDW